MWTTSLVTKVQEGTRYRVRVSFLEDGVARDEREFLVDSFDQLKQQVRNHLELLKAIDTLKDVVLGQLDPTEAPLTPAQQEEEAYFRDLRRLRQIKELVTLGVFTGTEAAITTLVTSVRNKFKPEYLG